MDQDNIIPLAKSGKSFNDALTDVLRCGAQQLLMQAVEAEVQAFLTSHQDKRLANGHHQIIRNGYLPERSIQTGIGDIAVHVPRTRDQCRSGIKFNSLLLPPYLKRTKSIDELLPYLYLKGLSSGDFSEALESLLGPEATGLSASSMVRLKERWQVDLDNFQARDLSLKKYVYFWADGVYLEARLESRQCMLVIIGCDETGKKELVALSAGFRESELSWHEVLLDLKQRGLVQDPKLCIGDGALGFWSALKKVYGQARHQRCWIHKANNVLDKMPKSLHDKAKQQLQEIWMKSDTKDEAVRSFNKFITLYRDKYPKATVCLNKDRESLLTFFDFPAAHWRSIRTTNPIESVFATVKHRTVKTKGCLSMHMAEIMTLKLIQAASKRWIRLNGSNHMATIIKGVKFKNGVSENLQSEQNSNNQQDQSYAA